VVRLLTLLLLAVVVAGCGSGTAPASAGARAAAARAPVRPAAGGGPARVAVLVLENHELGQTVGSAAMPYLTRLARANALATNYHALTHPSLPNYIALLAGTTAHITDDCAPADCPVHRRSLVDQLERHQVSWRAYMEGLPRACYPAAAPDTGRYAQRHNPFAYFSRVAGDRARCRHVVPASRLAGDERRGLPRFTWLTPDLCHDAHDCQLSTADAYLRRTVPGLLRALGRRGVLLITFDEGTTLESCCGRRSGGGRVALVAAGARARRGVRWGAPRDHVATLATVEDLLGLPRLATTRRARPLSGLLR
jgi:hypothetical protein